MEQLLSRDDFRNKSLKRDGYKCVVCKTPGDENTLSVHHILDRKLFENGGYYLSNGATLCEECHIKAEQCELSVEEIREAAGIKIKILPEGLLEEAIYDKWGEPVTTIEKYGRSLHATISLGTTSDDRFMPKGYIEKFIKIEEKHGLVLTEKLDGQNNAAKKNGAFARSHAVPTQHAWDKDFINWWRSIKDELGNVELFGESMYAVHSIAYKKLESYYYLFGVRQDGLWLSWSEVKDWSNILTWQSLTNIPTVPEIPIQISLKECWEMSTTKNEDTVLRNWLKYNLGMDWEEYVETGGQLEGYDSETGKPCCEGLVIRSAGRYKINEGHLPVDANEFDSLFKLVRKKHVRTDEHWTKNWKRAKLKWEF
jgi:hypothetical protein